MVEAPDTMRRCQRFARGGAADGGEVDAEVGIEMAVLRGEHGAPHMRRERGERSRACARAVVGADVTEEAPAARDDAERGHRRLAELARERREERDDADEHERSREQRRERDEKPATALPHPPTAHLPRPPDEPPREGRRPHARTGRAAWGGEQRSA